MDMRTVNNNVKFQDFNRKQANSLLNIVKNIEHYPHLSPLCLTTEINLKNQLKDLKEFCQGKIEEFPAPKLFAEQCCQWHGRLLKKNALVSCLNPPWLVECHGLYHRARQADFLPCLHFSKRSKTCQVMYDALQPTTTDQAPAASESNVAPNVSGQHEPPSAASWSENSAGSITEGPSVQISRDLQKTMESADSNKRQKMSHGEHVQEGHECDDARNSQQVSYHFIF